MEITVHGQTGWGGGGGILEEGEKTPAPKTRVSIWTLLRTPGRFTTRPLPVYFTTRMSVVRPFSVLSKDRKCPLVKRAVFLVRLKSWGWGSSPPFQFLTCVERVGNRGALGGCAPESAQGNWGCSRCAPEGAPCGASTGEAPSGQKIATPENRCVFKPQSAKVWGSFPPFHVSWVGRVQKHFWGGVRLYVFPLTSLWLPLFLVAFTPS